MWSRSDNQEVGLEAATLERVRNSSLVKWFRADNVTGLKHAAEAAAVPLAGGWVGERHAAGEAAAGASGGRCMSENAGMSSERGVRSSSAD
jgi:hypothetical protein